MAEGIPSSRLAKMMGDKALLRARVGVHHFSARRAVGLVEVLGGELYIEWEPLR
jgi:hypothetical protein